MLHKHVACKPDLCCQSRLGRLRILHTAESLQNFKELVGRLNRCTVLLQVIRMRYGLHTQDGRGMTLGDLSAAYGLTKERIRQLEDSALHKLRRHKGLLTAHLQAAGAVPCEPVVAPGSTYSHAY